MIYMTHAKHGRMPVYSQSEADGHKKNGWTQDEPVVPRETFHEVIEDALIDEEPKRRGRPPKVR